MAGIVDGSVDIVIGTHRLLQQTVRFKDLGLVDRRRGAALRRRAQGVPEVAAHGGRRADDVGHADPAHAGDVADRHPRDDDDPHPARGAAPDPDVRRRLRPAPDRRGDPPRTAARRAGVLHPQPGRVDQPGGGAAGRARARGAHRRGARADGRGRAGADHARLLGEGVRRPGRDDDRRVRAGHPQRQHPDRRPGRHVRALAAAPAARPGGAGPRARLRLLHLPARAAADRDGLRPAGHHRPAHRDGRRHGRRDEGPRDPRLGQPARRRAVRAHRRASASTCTCGWSARRSPTSGRPTARRPRPSSPTSRSTCRSTPTCPASTCPGERLRLEAYRALASATTDEAVDAVRAELVDRYGPIPPPVENLLAVARFKVLCRRYGVTEVSLQGSSVRFTPAGAARVGPAAAATGSTTTRTTSRRCRRCRCPGPRAWSSPTGRSRSTKFGGEAAARRRAAELVRRRARRGHRIRRPHRRLGLMAACSERPVRFWTPHR